ncbi:ankyrin repeat domain-containing protein [Fictibacillus sp. 5RED26]|uniref:ankyrin repeat domain-containing protein n=1 Tax=Fictibacillus sp. 5RED26 TaxID=2745876 RepID=UPI0018CE21F5|nr:ankyrin repeat domain-containing protein [Fictibacillus sp. 5RED26]MBH0156674.1 ankyrin repeat domain-containing protein [Fictibacillus sp. 5RED26]
MHKNQLAKDMRLAVKNGELDTLKDLLQKDIDMLTWMTPFGTWLHVAAAHGHIEIVKHLIKAGLDSNAQGGTFSTNALERAAAKGHLEIADYLISQNIEMDTTEPDRNPLFAAIYGGHLDIVKLLVRNNIDLSINYSSETMKDMDAYSFARERGQTEIAEYLKKEMGVLR